MTDPYAAPIHPGSPVPAPAPAKPRNVFAPMALVLAGLSVLVGIVVQLALPVMMSVGSYQGYIALTLVAAIFRVVLSLVAIVLALVGLQRAGNRAILGAALGVAIVEIVVLLVGFLSTTFLQVL